MQLAS